MNYDDLRKKALRTLEISGPPTIVVGPDGSITTVHSQEYKDAVKTLAEIDAMERAPGVTGVDWGVGDSATTLQLFRPPRNYITDPDAKYIMDLISKKMKAETREVKLTPEQEGRALIEQIEAATREGPNIYRMLYRAINPDGPIFSSESIRWTNVHYCDSGWTRMPVKSHVLPTEGGCAFDPKEPREWEPSRVERARERQFPGIHKRWYAIEGRWRSHWGSRHKDMLLTHARVHRDLGGPGSTINCQFCMLSDAMQECGLPLEWAAYVLRKLARSNAAKTADLIAGWMEQRQIAKSPTLARVRLVLCVVRARFESDQSNARGGCPHASRRTRVCRELSCREIPSLIRLVSHMVVEPGSMAFECRRLRYPSQALLLAS